MKRISSIGFKTFHSVNQFVIKGQNRTMNKSDINFFINNKSSKSYKIIKDESSLGYIIIIDFST
jgi:hypothetical protein